MSSYQSAIRTPTNNGQSEQPKLKDKTRQLQSVFPSWSQDDLQSLLVEVNGDVELAATRISDGQAEQWGSVSRKKDKKPGHTAKDSFSSPPSRGADFRGGRGGARGGRGGTGRGGAVRARGDFRGGRGGHSNGHISRTSSPAVGQAPDSHLADASKPPAETAVTESTPSTSETPATWPEPDDNGSVSAWGAPAASSSTSAWGAPDAASDANHHINVNGSTPASNHITSPTPAKQISKSPATSKLSWAQIARPQEKPTPPPAPIQQQPPQPPASSLPHPTSTEHHATSLTPSTSTPALAPPESEPSTNTGWEDPTTVQAPTWDEEPSAPAAASEPPKETEQESEPEPVPAPQEEPAQKPSEPAIVEPAAPAATSNLAPPTPTPSTPSKVAARPAPVSQRNSARYHNYAKIASDQGGVVMPPTPSSIGANLSSVSSFGTFGDLKSSGVEKVGMQFGSLSLGGDDAEPEPESSPVAPEAPSPRVSTASAAAQTSEPAATAPPTSASLNSGLYQSQSQPLQTSLSQPAVTASSSAPSSGVSTSPAQSYQQQVPAAQPHAQQPQSLAQLPQQLQQQATQTHQQQSLPTHHPYAQHGLPTHIDPSSQAQAQAQSPQQLQQTQQQSYLRQNDQSPYGGVAGGVSSGFHHTPTPPTQDNNGYGAFGGLGGQSLGGQQGLGITGQGLGGMGQNALGGMGALMGALGNQGVGQQQQQQQQQSLSAFGDYGYEGGQRSFYDYQPNAFGGRSVLGGHDDLKGGLPSQQQGPQTPSTTSASASTNSLPQSASTQSSVPQSAQSPATSVSSSAQGQPQPGQGPAYHPAAPVPTYYYQPFPHQNSYYGATMGVGAPYNSGYGVGGMGVGVGVPQPYPGMNVGKYPTMYPGPPGHASAPSPAGKPSQGMGVVSHGHGGVIGHSGLGVQPQSYGGGLYGQGGGYDDYQHHSQQPHHQQQGHQHHSSHNLSLGQDYSKPLYGGQGGLQGFMSGAGGAGSAGVAGSGGGPRGNASPETAYKPYTPKDVGVGGVGRGNVQQGQGQGQSQSQGQGQGQGGPQGQGFYGGNRFGSTGSVGAAPQQSAHHQGAPLYPQQGQSDAGYYYQQQRQQQQQYWQ